MTHGVDLFEDGFPHGTKAGFDRGCRGHGACPGVVDFGRSCNQASMAYAGDYTYKKRVDAGLSPVEIRELEESDKAAAVPAKRVVATGTNRIPGGNERVYEEPTVTVESSVTPLDVAPKLEKEEAEQLVEGIPLSKHGTASGYWAGCQLKDECPAKATTGTSCTNAASEYQRSRKTQPKGADDDSISGSIEVVGDLTVSSPLALDGAAVDSVVAAVHRGVPAEDILHELADTKETLARVIRERDGFEEELAAARRRIGDLTDELGQAAIALDVEKSATRDKAVAELRTVLMSGEVATLQVDRKPAELSIMSVGEGMKLAFEGDGRLELDFAGGQLTHAAVSTESR